MFIILVKLGVFEKMESRTEECSRLARRLNDFANSQKLMFRAAINTDDMVHRTLSDVFSAPKTRPRRL